MKHNSWLSGVSSQSRASNPKLTAVKFVAAIESLEVNETVLQLNIPSANPGIVKNWYSQSGRGKEKFCLGCKSWQNTIRCSINDSAEQLSICEAFCALAVQLIPLTLFQNTKSLRGQPNRQISCRILRRAGLFMSKHIANNVYLTEVNRCIKNHLNLPQLKH